MFDLEDGIAGKCVGVVKEFKDICLHTIAERAWRRNKVTCFKKLKHVLR